MEKYGLDALIASTPTNVTYLSNFRAMSHENLGAYVFAVFPGEKNLEPFLVLPSGELADLLALKMTWITDVRIYGTFYVNFPKSNELSEDWESSLAGKLKSTTSNDPFVVLKDALQEKGLLIKQLGVDERGFKGEDYQKFLKVTGIEKAIPAFDIFREIRKIKNEEEIAVMREAIEITELGIKAAVEGARVGSSGSDMVRDFSETVVRRGMTNFLPSISLGTESYLQHNYFPSSKKLQRGDLIRFDVACQYKYHFTDIGRNAVIGNPSARQKECYNVVRAGEESAIASLRPGVKASEVFKAGVEGARRAGMPGFQRNHCGHGIGLEMYELPFITPASNDVIEKNCILNIETPYYEISNGGYMVEDTILVTDRGTELLTKLDRDLIEIPV